MTLGSLRGKFILSLAMGVAVVLGLAVYGDLPNILGAVRDFNWALLPLIIGLTLGNYGLRYIKWEFYLKIVGIRGIRRRDSFLIFFGGLSMVMTPGKVGEWLKSFLLKEVADVPYTRSAPIIVAERLSDGIAMMLLALAGVLVFNLGTEIVIVGAVVIGAVVAAIQIRPIAFRLLGLASRVPLIASRAHDLRALYDSSYELFRPKALAIAVGIGLVSWGLECVALYLVYIGLGVPATAELLLQSTFILASATLAGSLLLMPGGLGVAEASIVGLSQFLLGVSREVASAGALLIRLSTLWFGVLVGVVCLLVYLRLRSVGRPQDVAGDADSSGELTPAR